MTAKRNGEEGFALCDDVPPAESSASHLYLPCAYIVELSYIFNCESEAIKQKAVPLKRCARELLEARQRFLGCVCPCGPWPDLAELVTPPRNVVLHVSRGR